MPGSITHTYIAYLCFQEAASAGLFITKMLSEILDCNNKKLIPLAKSEGSSYTKKYVDSRDPEIILPSYAYLGCNGPDIFYMAGGNPDDNGKPAADILHYNKTGPNVIWALRTLRTILKNDGDLDFSARRRLAYWLGHISHIAADVIVHPFINSIVAAYPDDHCEYDTDKEKGTGDSRFEPFGGKAQFKNLFRFHNVVEHWHDAYVLYWILIPKDRAGFGNWESVNLCAGAAADLRRNKNNFFILKNLEYYGYTIDDLKKIGINITNYTDKNDFEDAKYELMSDTNFLPPDVKWYVKSVLPDNDYLKEHFKARSINNIIQPYILGKYISRAVKFTLKLWKEVDQYFSSATVNTEAEDEYDMNDSKKYFPLLRRHWNLDTGFSPDVTDREDNKKSDDHINTEYEPKLETTNKNLIEVHLPFVVNYDSYMEDGDIEDIPVLK